MFILNVLLYLGLFSISLSIGFLIYSGRRNLDFSYVKPAFLSKKEKEVKEEIGYIKILYPCFKYFGNLIENFFKNRNFEPYKKYKNFISDELKFSGQIAGLLEKEFMGAIITIFIILQLITGYYQMTIFGALDGTWLMIMGLISIIFPNFWLMEIKGERVKKINKKLPYTMNVLVLCMEAGLDFISAVKTSTEKNKQKDDPLRDEFLWMQNELEMGKTKSEALRNLSDKIPSDYVFAFVNSIIQAERLGSPISKVIKVQAESIGIKRMQKAEKKAGEAAVLILGPLLFIFVATFLVLFAHFIIRYFETGSVV